MKKEDTKKQPTQSKKPKNNRIKKNTPQKPGKKRPSKPSKTNQKKNQPIKKTNKPNPAKNHPNKKGSNNKGSNNKGQNNKNKDKNQTDKSTNKPEIPFITKPTIEETWTIETIERYILAVRRAFEKIPVTEQKEIDLREIWMNSSLPADLILKIIADHGEKIGITKHSLFLDGKVVY